MHIKPHIDFQWLKHCKFNARLQCDSNFLINLLLNWLNVVIITFYIVKKVLNRDLKLSHTLASHGEAEKRRWGRRKKRQQV